MDPAVVKALREAKALHDDGVLTSDEFTRQKRVILKGGTKSSGIHDSNEEPSSTRDAFMHPLGDMVGKRKSKILYSNTCAASHTEHFFDLPFVCRHARGELPLASHIFPWIPTRLSMCFASSIARWCFVDSHASSSPE